ncbi:MAG: hypothetical protein GSR85_03175 [Desulfurococcales archaeon]|nr:hypothetical protein [Desulfurococcales archaeon]
MVVEVALKLFYMPREFGKEGDKQGRALNAGSPRTSHSLSTQWVAKRWGG